MLTGEQIERLEFAVGRADLLSSALGDCVVRIDRETARALLQLARAVNDAPAGIVKWDASVRIVDFVGDEPDWREGQTVALVPVKGGE
jgi:hypothetical protein